MSTNYPSGVDEFHEPSQPEITSLSQVGGQAAPGRNHVEHHRDLGDAVQALQAHASQRGHDHSGNGNSTVQGNKLSQANTHQNADTDGSLTAIHHTLGGQPFQAAPGNHTHDYDGGTILNRPYIRCTSATRPQNPTPGLSIYETDTNRMWVWNNFGNGSGLRWNIQPAANIPMVRLTQSSTQPISSSGTAIQWAKNVGDEDNFNYFNPSNNTKIKVTEPGVYQIDLAVQWGTNFLPEVCTVVVYVGNQPTVLRHSIFQPPSVLSVLGQLIDSDYSITVPISGKLRLAINDEVSVRARYSGIIPIFGTIINTYLDAPSNVKSRIEMNSV